MRAWGVKVPSLLFADAHDAKKSDKQRAGVASGLTVGQREMQIDPGSCLRPVSANMSIGEIRHRKLIRDHFPTAVLGKADILRGRELLIPLRRFLGPEILDTSEALLRFKPA